MGGGHSTVSSIETMRDGRSGSSACVPGSATNDHERHAASARSPPSTLRVQTKRLTRAERLTLFARLSRTNASDARVRERTRGAVDGEWAGQGRQEARSEEGGGAQRVKSTW